MIQALPREEAEYYSWEENVAIQGANSESIFQEVTEQYGFIGGSLEQYVSYFARRLPQNMWAWAHEDEVQAIAGFSTVPKKPRPDGSIPLRKLFMCRAAKTTAWSMRRAERTTVSLAVELLLR